MALLAETLVEEFCIAKIDVGAECLIKTVRTNRR